MAAETPETPAVIAETVEDIPQELTETRAKSATAEQQPSNGSSDVALHATETVPESDVEQPAKKKPGRPAGSRNKAPAKPRVKKVVVSEAVEYAPPPSPISSPRWDAQHQPIPIEAHNEMAALMLRMLSGQSMERQRRKEAQRKAWFS